MHIEDFPVDCQSGWTVVENEQTRPPNRPCLIAYQMNGIEEWCGPERRGPEQSLRDDIARAAWSGPYGRFSKSAWRELPLGS